MLRVSVDIGGTFTDMVLSDPQGNVAAFKAPSTPGELARGVMHCFEKAAAARGTGLTDLLAQVDSIVHGTTATTNALLTRTGARTAMITTRGFRDIIELRRGIRVGHSPYNLKVDFPKPLVRRDDIVGVPERVRCNGEVIEPLDEEAVRAAAVRFRDQGIEAVAICFLFSHINPSHELRAKAIVQQTAPDLYVATSSEVLPAAREFERFNTTVGGAYGGPIFSAYIDRLEVGLRDSGFAGNLVLIQSNGGIQDIAAAKRNPVSTLLSGPAAGPAAGVFLGGSYSDNIISVDIGGTSFEVSLIRNRETLLTTETWLSEQRLAVKLVDVHSIGAGGGSIAWIDPLGLLRVGPQSAGSRPDPACYGRGGDVATVTDANLALGYIDPAYFLGGEIPLDAEAARRVIADRVAAPLGIAPDDAAHAIFDMINEGMADALNERCTKRGFDPRAFLLISAGGAGGLHAATIARKARIRNVMIPRFAATYCAFGMQLPDDSHDYVRSYAARTDAIDPERVEALFAEMRKEGAATLRAAGVAEADMAFARSVDMRYLGQFHEVEVPMGDEPLGPQATAALVAGFHRGHEARFAFALPERKVEILYLRLRAVGKTVKPWLKDAEARSDARSSRKGTRPAYFGREVGWVETAVLEGAAMAPGEAIAGPAIIEDPTTTILVPGDFRGEVDSFGNFFLTHTA